MSDTPPNDAASTRGYPSVTQSLQEYARGVAGGLIFSLPLLFTMEMWWAGMILSAPRLLLYVLVTFVLLLGYNRYVGLHRKTSPLEVLVDSVEEMGIGLVIAAAMLLLLGRISMKMPPGEMLGILTIEAMTVAIGVSVGTAQLGTPDDNSDQQKEEEDEASATLGGELAIAACGAMLFASNVAPTEEIVKLAAEMSSLRLLLLALLSFLLGAMVLYFSDFRGAERFAPGHTVVGIFGGAAQSYAVGLIVSAATLWFFGRFDGMSGFFMVAQTVVLGLPGALGASAGRLLLQTR